MRTLLLLSLCTAMPAFAQVRADTETRHSTNTATDTVDTAYQAKQWSLTEEDWRRYEEIMRGPRRYWSPNLDPLTALGMEARNDQERRRYAELQARIEYERVERETAYQRAYDEAFNRLYPGQQLIRPEFAMPTSAAASGNGRLAVFVERNCPSCDRFIKSLQDRDLPFDVFMLGSDGQDSVIRDWASSAGIAVADVQSRRITLNHDNGTLRAILPSATAQPKLPAAFERTALGWKRVD